MGTQMPARSFPLLVFFSLLAAFTTGALTVRGQSLREADRRKASADVRELGDAELRLHESLRSLGQLQRSGSALAPTRVRLAFAALAAQVEDDPITTSLVLEEPVPVARRAAFERRTGLRIRQLRDGMPLPLQAHGGRFLVVVEGRSDVTPRAGLLGLDVLADPARRRAVAAAARTGRLRATPVVAGIAQRGPSVVVYAPLGRPRAGGLPGFVAAGYSLSGIADRLTTGLPPGTQLRVTDGATVVTGRPLRRPGARRTTSFAGRRWTIALATPRAAVSSAWATILALGTMLALLLGALALWADRRFGRVREQRDDAQARFASAFRAAPIGMLVVGFDGRVMQANAAFATLAGLPAASAVGHDCLELVHPEDRAGLREGFGELATGRAERFGGERRIVDAHGTVVWIRIDATAIDAGTAAHRDGRLLVQVQDIGERRRYEAQLQHMADHDPLTGLFNRRAFEAELERHVLRCRRYGHRGAVLVLDLDDFKAINDTLGHAVGDQLIERVAAMLRERLRGSDVVARLGGDEFAVLMPDTDRAGVAIVAEDVLELVKGLRVERGNGDRPRGTTASVGVVLVEQLEVITAEGLLVCADLAMYDAKEAGRDRFAVHTEAPQGFEGTQSRLTWTQRLHDALAEDRFALWAQPIVELATGRVAQHEILLRYVDDDGALIGPAEFLPVAERFGLIGEIDAWVVRNAIAELARRDATVTFEVNLSGGSLGDPGLLDLIESELRRTRVDPGRLIFEVTETTAVSNIPRARDFAERLGDIGCRFALDDFGAGFGSFYYLKHLPFDIVKIDGEFIRSAVDGHVDQLVIEAVVGIAGGMAKTTVAEQVGDDATVGLLRTLGVDYGQGFHLGRPGPLDVVVPVAAAAPVV